MTEQTQAITESKPNTAAAFYEPLVLQQMEHIATKLVNSNALPSSIKNAAQLLMVLMAGHEAGMSAMESINSYYIVNGKITIYGDAVIRQLRRAGWKIKWNETTDSVAEVVLSKDGEDSHTERYTIEEAAASGLSEKSIWKQYPKEMLRHKAIGRGVRFTCPEVLGGLYLKEELEHEVVIDTTANEVQPAELGPCTLEQKQEIVRLASEAGATTSQISDFIKTKFGCDIQDLTLKNAAIAIRALEKRVEQGKEQPEQVEEPAQEQQPKEPQVEAQPEPEPEKPKAVSGEVVDTPATDDKTAEQLSADEIDAIFSK